MAGTGLFGGVYFDPEVFGTYMAEQETWTNNVILSRIVAEDQTLVSMLSEKGNVGALPMTTPLNVYDNLPLNNDGETDQTPTTTSTKKQIAMMINIMQSWKAAAFTSELTGEMPLENVGNRVADYYAQAWQLYLMRIAKAALGVTGLESHTTNIATATTTYEDVNLMQADTLIDAKQAALGDMADNLGIIVMHSKVFARFQKLGLVNYATYDGVAGLEREITLPTINGMFPIVNDRETTAKDGNDNNQYFTYLYGDSAFLSANKTNLENPYYAYYDGATDGGTDILFTKQARVLHPNGLSLAVANIAKESPTLAELSNTANWSLVADHKNVRIGCIVTNG